MDDSELPPVKFPKVASKSLIPRGHSQDAVASMNDSAPEGGNNPALTTKQGGTNAEPLVQGSEESSKLPNPFERLTISEPNGSPLGQIRTKEGLESEHNSAPAARSSSIASIQGIAPDPATAPGPNPSPTTSAVDTSVPAKLMIADTDESSGNPAGKQESAAPPAAAAVKLEAVSATEASTEVILPTAWY